MVCAPSSYCGDTPDGVTAQGRGPENPGGPGPVPEPGGTPGAGSGRTRATAAGPTVGRTGRRSRRVPRRQAIRASPGAPAELRGGTPDGSSDRGISPAWKEADVIFPKGTRSVRFHFNDVYTYADSREVLLSLHMVGQALGWTTYVYSDSSDLYEELGVPLRTRAIGCGASHAGPTAGRPGLGISGHLPSRRGGRTSSASRASMRLWRSTRPASSLQGGSHDILVKADVGETFEVVLAVAAE